MCSCFPIILTFMHWDLHISYHDLCQAVYFLTWETWEAHFTNIFQHVHFTGPSSQKNAEIRKFAAKSITVDWQSLIEMQHDYLNIHQENSNIQRGIKEQNSVTWSTVLVDNKNWDRMTAGGLTTWMVRNYTRISWKEKWRRKCKWNNTK
jgi:hypothetical protein